MISKILNVINFIVFLLATILVASIFYEGLTATVLDASTFYEGLTLMWYDFVPIFLIFTDMFFILAVILNLLFNRRNKVIVYLNIFSVIFISIMLILKYLKIKHPGWSVTAWYFFILYFYGTQVIVDIYKYMHRGAKNGK